MKENYSKNVFRSVEQSIAEFEYEYEKPMQNKEKYTTEFVINSMPSPIQADSRKRKIDTSDDKIDIKKRRISSSDSGKLVLVFIL